jgi:hypothetical protein
MAGVARAMKRHGLTTKPALRLVNTVRSGDVDYYMFDLSDSGRHYTIAKHEFWRGGGTAHWETRTLEDSSPPPAPPHPAPPVEYVRVRDMKTGDIVSSLNAPKGKPREVIRVVPGAPNYALHYVWEGSVALRTSLHLPGAKFILRKRSGE